MNVEVLTTLDPACEAFVQQTPDGKICHLPVWSDAVARAARLKSFYLVACDSGHICGVLPLVHAKSILLGNFMVSQGFSDYGSILADSDEARDALFNYAVELATVNNCQTIEFRNIQPLPFNLEPRTGKICMHLPLSRDPDEIWKSFKSKVRNHVRKAEKSNIVAVDGHIELLDDFYRVYTIRMHELGTPAYPRKLMRYLLEAFPDNSRLFVARLNGLTIGIGLTFHFNGFVEIPFASTLTQYNSLCPNDLLYWYIIKYYCLAGAECFDFGRCTVDGPTYQFKKEWGTEPVALHYQYWVRPGHQLSILSPDNPKYKRKVEIWKRLPLWATRLLGPYISCNLP
jgi:FemAB-related protein (PEP-CTERM system-associated)